jgi:Lrp/AsnC family leucine-responsive transcriptional regulator
MATDLDAFSRLSLDVLLNLPNVKDVRTSFSLGEVKAITGCPNGRLQSRSRRAAHAHRGRMAA